VPPASTDFPDSSLVPPSVPGPYENDDIDPELLALPPPAKGQRQATVLLLLIVALTASAMAIALRGEALYALTPPTELDIGELYTVNTATLTNNRYVHAHGSLGGALAVRFERPFEADTYRVSPVMGRRDLWVEIRVPSGEEGARYVPPTSFSGRMVRWSESGLRHRGLAGAVGSITHETVPEGAWLLVDGQAPSSARWTLGLALMFAAFAVWCLVTTGRLLRRVSE
jgi:hypothetical protein